MSIFALLPPPALPSITAYENLSVEPSTELFPYHLSQVQDTTQDLLAQINGRNLWNTSLYCEPVIVNIHDNAHNKTSFKLSSRENLNTLTLRPQKGGYFTTISGIGSFPLMVKSGNREGSSVVYSGQDQYSGAEVKIGAELTPSGFALVKGEVFLYGSKTPFQRVCQIGQKY